MRWNRLASPWTKLPRCVSGVLRKELVSEGRRTPVGTNVLHEGWEPGNEGEGIAPVSIGDTIDRFDGGLLVESEVDPADEPSKLNQDPRILESDDAEDSGKGKVGHGKGLRESQVYGLVSRQLILTLTRTRITPINWTLCSGISWVKATKRPICRAV